MKERLNRILRSVIESYIENGEPVSSKGVLEREEDMNVSSATVRNDLSELERLGYLKQPHTSAGRIPTEAGYRYYVDNLLPHKELDKQLALSLDNAIQNSTMSIDEFFKTAISAFSKITGYTSAAVISHNDDDRIIKMEVVKSADNMINLIVITKSGVVKNSFCRLYFLASDEEVLELNKTLESYIGNTNVGYLDDEMLDNLEKELARKQNNWDFIAGVIKNIVSSIKKPHVFISGQEKMLSYPEFYEIHKAKNVMSFLSQEEQVYGVLNKNPDNMLNIIIGSEIGGETLSDMGLVVRRYNGDGNEYTFSLFGPKRMDYGKTVSQVEYFIKCIERYLKDRGQNNVGE